MKRLLCLVLLMFVMSPLMVMAEDENAKPENSDAMFKTKSMISSRVFMEKGGVEKMKEASAGLSEEWRGMQYAQNRKMAALGWLSLLVPSLGNWIVGDKVGGVVSVVGFVGSYITFYVGYLSFYSSYYKAYNSAYSSKTTSISVDYSGLYVMLVGSLLMVGFEIYSVVSALSYAGTYNENLKDGLGLEVVYNDPVEMGQKAMADANNLPKPAPDLIHMNLLSVSF